MATFKETDERVVPALLRERAALLARDDAEGVKLIDEQLKLRGYVKKDATAPEKVPDKTTPPVGRTATPPNSKG